MSSAPWKKLNPTARRTNAWDHDNCKPGGTVEAWRAKCIKQDDAFQAALRAANVPEGIITHNGTDYPRYIGLQLRADLTSIKGIET